MDEYPWAYVDNLQKILHCTEASFWDDPTCVGMKEELLDAYAEYMQATTVLIEWARETFESMATPAGNPRKHVAPFLQRLHPGN